MKTGVCNFNYFSFLGLSESKADYFAEQVSIFCKSHTLIKNDVTVHGPANKILVLITKGAQWLNGTVLDTRLRVGGFEPHRRHCIVVLEQNTFILA